MQLRSRTSSIAQPPDGSRCQDGGPKIGDGEREKLRNALDTGESWHAVSIATKIPYSTVKKHARKLGYEPRRRLPTAAAKNPHG